MQSLFPHATPKTTHWKPLKHAIAKFEIVPVATTDNEKV
jgi:hypothetical protein